MKSSICSPRTIRKFFLVSGSPINLYTTKYDCICHLRSTEDQSFTNAFQHQTAKCDTGGVCETSGTKNRVQFHIRRRSTSEWTHHTGRPRPYY